MSEHPHLVFSQPTPLKLACKLPQVGAADPNGFSQLPSMLEDGVNQTRVMEGPLLAFRSAQTQHAKAG